MNRIRIDILQAQDPMVLCFFDRAYNFNYHHFKNEKASFDIKRQTYYTIIVNFMTIFYRRNDK